MIGRWIIRIVAVASILVAILVAIVDASRGFPSGGFYPIYGAVSIVFIVVGWLICERRSGNAVGPLLLTFGALFAWYLPADLVLHQSDPPPAADMIALFVSMLDAPMFIVIGLTLVLFPDGRSPSPRWRWTLVAAVVGIAMTVSGVLLAAEPFPSFPSYRSPFGIPDLPIGALSTVAYVVVVILLVAAIAALVVRWRRGDPMERTQLKWVAAATVVLFVSELVNIATYRPDAPNAITNAIGSLAIALVPIAMGIAILRYRLYDIDRVISRSVGYATVTVILAVLFAGLNLLLQAVLALFTAGQSVAVAASTLAVFALFQPIRRRVQHAVDQRFDRARYDGERIAAAFSGRLRYETDMETVTSDLARTADSAMAPAALGIWLRSGASR
jgi:N-terminal 7TM region of histidine kinase